ncbi:terpene synthase family protein [Nocardia wallacei]|uniref:terpene synthase family protein n=1 Tax=Nocardia wallacei TaxID=480035 RepID=UPI0024541925|nr:hypothetical protein [Nocardia wallacei]
MAYSISGESGALSRLNSSPKSLPDFGIPFESRRSPDGDAARERNIVWLRRHGLLATSAQECMFRSYRIADLTALWVPEASGSALDVAVDTIALATLIEDQFDGLVGFDESVARSACRPFFEVLEAGCTDAAGPWAAAFLDIWDRMRMGRSSGWCDRAARNWRGFLDACCAEAGVRGERRTLGVRHFLENRRESGFTYTMIDLIESSYNFETTTRARNVPELRSMVDITADVVDTVNDLVSVEKEENSKDVHNLIFVLEREENLSREDSLTEVLRRLRRWCAYFSECENKLADQCVAAGLMTDETNSALRLGAAMRLAMGGHPSWYAATGRYN